MIRKDSTSGVSPVVGVVLLVGITIALSSVVGLFIFNNFGGDAPTNLENDLGLNVVENTDGSIETTITSGSSTRVDILVNGSVVSSRSQVNPGDNIRLNNETVPPGSQVTIISGVDSSRTVVSSFEKQTSAQEPNSEISGGDSGSNNPPTIVSELTANNGDLISSDSHTTFSIKAVDADGDKLLYKFDPDGDGLSEFNASLDSGETYTPSHFYGSVQNPIEPTVTVTDGTSSVSSSTEIFGAIEATGGTMKTIEDGDSKYRIHAFTNTGTNDFTISSGSSTESMEVLIVAGGGGGGGGDSGDGSGGGGGAGGLIFKEDVTVSTGTESITVGSGGSGGRFDGSNGEDTTAFGFTAIGGGGGGDGDATNDGLAGGSGGGGGGNDGPNSGGNALQPNSPDGGFGNPGGKATTNSGDEGGGGGGAGEAGENGRSASDIPPSGPGGDGLKEVTLDGTTHNFATLFTTEFGEDADSDGNSWFAGGGAGHADERGGGLIEGGKGGGGSFHDNERTMEPGMPNTGGGGAGGGKNEPSLTGADGGSGIVLIRYQIS